MRKCSHSVRMCINKTGIQNGQAQGYASGLKKA
jgi:hypothetical protein